MELKSFYLNKLLLLLLLILMKYFLYKSDNYIYFLVNKLFLKNIFFAWN